jgi:hypothetical protein
LKYPAVSRRYLIPWNRRGSPDARLARPARKSRLPDQGIGRGQEDKRGQDNRHGYKAIVKTTEESVEPLGQISPSLAQRRLS